MIIKTDKYKIRAYNFNSVLYTTCLSQACLDADTEGADCLVCDCNGFKIIRKYGNKFFKESTQQDILSTEVYGYIHNYPLYVHINAPVDSIGVGVLFNSNVTQQTPDTDEIKESIKKLCEAWKNGDKISDYIEELEKLV